MQTFYVDRDSNRVVDGTFHATLQLDEYQNRPFTARVEVLGTFFKRVRMRVVGHFDCTMSMNHFMHIVQRGALVGKEIVGSWTFRKRNGFIGLYLHDFDAGDERIRDAKATQSAFFFALKERDEFAAGLNIILRSRGVEEATCYGEVKDRVKRFLKGEQLPLI